MFRDKAFTTALLVSLSWHLICMFAVQIVVLPGKYRARDLTSVSFLGPILEKTALDIILAHKPVAVTTTYQRDLKYTHTLRESRTMPKSDEIGEYIGAQEEERMDRVFGLPLPRDKAVPRIAVKPKHREAPARRPTTASELSQGREVIYKPQKPKLPAWTAASAPFKLTLEFIVSPQGEVKEVVPAVSSGDAEVDLIGIRYLKNWRFAPLASGQAEQRGSAELVFEVGE